VKYIIIMVVLRKTYLLLWYVNIVIQKAIILKRMFTDCQNLFVLYSVIQYI